MPSKKKSQEDERSLHQELKGFGYEVIGMDRAYGMIAIEVFDVTNGRRWFGIDVTVLGALKRLRSKLHLKPR